MLSKTIGDLKNGFLYVGLSEKKAQLLQNAKGDAISFAAPLQVAMAVGKYDHFGQAHTQDQVLFKTTCKFL
jgi:hypothetical protein